MGAGTVGTAGRDTGHARSVPIEVYMGVDPLAEDVGSLSRTSGPVVRRAHAAPAAHGLRGDPPSQPTAQTSSSRRADGAVSANQERGS